MRISVVIPSYNRADFVGRTLHSALRQTRLPEEILVVDDGSEDDTGQLVATLSAGTGGRVRYLRRENGGLSAARNTGQQNAAPDSDALLFLDSDDLMEPTLLAKLEQALVADSEAVLSFCRARYINADDAPVVIPNTALSDQPAGIGMWEHLVSGNCIRSAGGVLVRRNALAAAGPWDEELRSNEDWDMWLRLAETGARFVCVPEALLLYRVHGQNMSGNRLVMKQTRLRVYEKQLDRHVGDAVKSARIRVRYEACLSETDSEPAPVMLAGFDSPLSYDSAMKGRHHRFRRLIERTGIAGLYRKTPMAWRLRLRVLFGIDPNA